VIPLAVILGRNCTKRDQLIPTPSDMSKLKRIISIISIKYHLTDKLAVLMRTYWDAKSLGVQNPPSLAKLTEAE
jgi:hypothetical protein